MKPKSKNRYVYLVYCNSQPIVYGCKSNLKSAIKYAKDLISYRFKKAQEKGYEYGYYHYIEENDIVKRNRPFETQDVIMFSACLKIKDQLENIFSDDHCFVQVKRYSIRK